MRDILVVEDNDGLREVLTEALSTGNFSVIQAASAEEGMEKIKDTAFDIVITDLKLPEADGIAVLEAAKAQRPDCDVIIITAYGTVDKAVDAMKKGAADFITKPFSIDQIRLMVIKAIKSKKIREENSYLKSIVKKDIIGRSGKLKSILEIAAKTAASDATVLITGESGTGKELIAEEIHSKSRRSEYPMVKVNCAALAPGILESELFGHEKVPSRTPPTPKKGVLSWLTKGLYSWTR